MNLSLAFEAECFFRQGLRLFQTRDYTGAIANFDKALSFQPDDYKTWFQRGLALGNLERHYDAIKSFDRALAVQPDAHRCWHNRAIAFGKLGLYLDAVNSFDRAIEFNPDAASSWHNRGLTLVDAGELDKAIKSFERSLELQPDAHWAWYNRGLALLQLNRYVDALNSFDRAIEFQPNSSSSWHYRGLVLTELGDELHASESFKRSQELQARVRGQMSNSNSLQEKETHSTVAEAPQYQLQDYLAWYNQGVELSRKQCYQDAIACYDKALNLRPNYSEAIYNKACCYALLGCIELAVTHLRYAIELQPHIYRQRAKTDADFVTLHPLSEFQTLLQD